MESEKITISCYENMLPSFVEMEMDRLYENVYSSLAKFRLDCASGNIGADVNTYVVQKDGRAMTVFLFRREKGEVKVMNELIRIDEEDVRRFASTIFNSFREINVISFSTIQTAIRKLPFPYQRFNVSEDVVVTLPNTVEEYLTHLGKATRKNILRHMSRLQRSFPTFHYAVYTKEQVDERQIRAIIALNRVRMAGKHKLSGIDENEIRRLIHLARQCGSVGVATIDGRVCGGQICYRIGANYFMSVVAHDSAYDEHRLGTLCCYLSICECIAQGGKECHFLWGRDTYKYTLLGVQRDLDHLVIYRSRLQLVLNGARALQGACKGAVRQVKLWLHTDGVMARFALKVLNHLRSLRRVRMGFLTPQK